MQAGVDVGRSGGDLSSCFGLTVGYGGLRWAKAGV